MQWNFDEVVEFFSHETRREILSEGLHGLEKEGLRVQPNGDLAQTPHPAALGSAFTDPHITTDFSESQLELITPPLASPKAALEFLGALHRRVATHLPNDEMIWPFSAPCRLPEEANIPIARYGDSPVAQTKEIYRKGLALRYGKTMQLLSGVHYNISFSERFWDLLWEQFGNGLERQAFINDHYLAIARNFMRHRWMLVYLFGASPVVDSSYQCKMLAKDKANAISLRLSRCGYSNPAKLHISYHSFDQHLADLEAAVNTPYSPYTALGVEREGERVQLNDHLLQIINEYYASVRLKATIEKVDLLPSLKQNGVQYLELRLFDINPFMAYGVDLKQLYFTHLFVLFCLFSDNPPMTETDLDAATQRQEDVALRGRELSSEWRKALCDTLNLMRPVAMLMPPCYAGIVDHYIHACEDPSQLPWARLITEMGSRDFIAYGLERAHMFHDSLTNFYDA